MVILNKIIPEIIIKKRLGTVGSNDVTIHDDIWTCSNEFREDINFFLKTNNITKLQK